MNQVEREKIQRKLDESFVKLGSLESHKNTTLRITEAYEETRAEIKKLLSIKYRNYKQQALLQSLHKELIQLRDKIVYSNESFYRRHNYEYDPTLIPILRAEMDELGRKLKAQTIEETKTGKERRQKEYKLRLLEAKLHYMELYKNSNQSEIDDYNHAQSEISRLESLKNPTFYQQDLMKYLAKKRYDLKHRVESSLENFEKSKGYKYDPTLIPILKVEIIELREELNEMED